MSLPSSRSVRLRVARDTVEGVLLQGWLRPKVLARAVRTIGGAAGVGAAARGPAAPHGGVDDGQQDVAEEVRLLPVDKLLTELEHSRSLEEARAVFGELEHRKHPERVPAQPVHRAAASNRVPVEPCATPDETHDEGQTRSIEAVLFELGETGSLRHARLDVEVAESLTHFDVVNGEFAGDTDRQLQSVADACVAELLGDAAPGHQVRWQLQTDGAHLLISAIPKDLLETLTESAARHAMHLRSVRPDFCVQWNRHSSSLRPGQSVFAVACGREAVVACVARGSIVQISNGGWLDRHGNQGLASVPADSLMSGIDIAHGTAQLLDARVDRLLASIGRTTATQSAYVLVAPKMPDDAVSSRWTVRSRDAQEARVA